MFKLTICLIFLTSAILITAPAKAETSLSEISNGNNSNNQITGTTSQNITVSQSNQSTIETTVNGILDSGNALSLTSINNYANNNVLFIPNCCQNNSPASISQTSKDYYISQNQTAVISNNIQHEGSTGENTLSYNLGNIKIITGSSTLISTIENEVNNNYTKILCDTCSSPNSLPGDPVSNPPTPPPLDPGNPNPPYGGDPQENENNNGNYTSPSSNQMSQAISTSLTAGVLGASTGEVLPATGNNSFIFITLLCFTTILSGLILRGLPLNQLPVILATS